MSTKAYNSTTNDYPKLFIIIQAGFTDSRSWALQLCTQNGYQSLVTLNHEKQITGGQPPSSCQGLIVTIVGVSTDSFNCIVAV